MDKIHLESDVNSDQEAQREKEEEKPISSIPLEDCQSRK
jgi:hypothetical protein